MRQQRLVDDADDQPSASSQMLRVGLPLTFMLSHSLKTDPNNTAKPAESASANWPEILPSFGLPGAAIPACSPTRSPNRFPVVEGTIY